MLNTSPSMQAGAHEAAEDMLLIPVKIWGEGTLPFAKRLSTLQTAVASKLTKILDVSSYQKRNDNHQHDWKAILGNAKDKLC